MISWRNWCLFHCAGPARWHSVFITSYYIQLKRWGCAQVRISHGLWARPLFEIDNLCQCAGRANRSKTGENPRKPQLFFFLVVCLFVCFGIALDIQRRRLRASKTVTNCCNARLTYWGSQQFKYVNAIFMKVLYACAEDHKMALSRPCTYAGIILTIMRKTS